MRFDIDDSYAITTDEYNFTLVFKRVVQEGPNKGKSYEQPVAYFSRLERALEEYAKKAMGTDDAKGDMKNFQPILDALVRVESAVRTVGKEFIEKFPPPTAKGSAA